MFTTKEDELVVQTERDNEILVWESLKTHDSYQDYAF